MGIIEAKAMYKDIPSVLDYQCKDYARHSRPEDYLAFAAFIRENMDKIAALTRESLKNLRLALDRAGFTDTERIPLRRRRQRGLRKTKNPALAAERWGRDFFSRHLSKIGSVWRRSPAGGRWRRRRCLQLLLRP